MKVAEAPITEASEAAVAAPAKAQIIDHVIQGGLALMLCAFSVVLYFSLHDNIVKAGDTAPNFKVTAENGKTITARDFGGKLLMLNFWATWCPPCVQETPSLDQLSRALAPKGLVVLGVSVDKDEAAYKAFIAKYHLSYLTARDPKQVVNLKYGTVQYPETYLIDQNGKVVEKVVGEENWSTEQMLQHVQSLL